MKNPINNNTYFNLIQPKIFNLLQYHISEDDPVRKLSAILMDMDFTKLLKVKLRYILLECLLSFFMLILEVFILLVILKMLV